MNIQKILGSNPLTPRKQISSMESPGEARTLHFDSFHFQNDPDFKVSFHNHPLPVSPHRHDYYEATYVYRGSFLHQTEQGEISLKTGDLFLVPPGKTHSVSNCSSDCHGINLLIHADYFTRSIFPLLTAQAACCREDFALFSCLNNPHVRSIVDSLLEERFFPDRQSKPFITCYLALLINECERLSRLSALNVKELQKKTLVAKIRQHIALHYQQISLSQLSTLFGYSENYISRLLKEETGYSFGEYKLNIQLEEAAQLLLQNNLSVNHVAELTGFSNYSFFYRKFNEKYHVTPAGYRRK